MSQSRGMGTSREKQVITDGLVLPGTTIGGEVGTFYVDFTLWSGDGSRSLELNGLVDTGASYTLIPASALTELGIEPEKIRSFQLANGNTQDFPVGRANIELENNTENVHVVFGPDNRILLGAMALEAFALAADAKNRRLVPADLTL